MPDHLRLFIKRFHRDESRIATMTVEVLAFLREVDELLATLAAARPYIEPAALERQPLGDHGCASEEVMPL